MINFELFRRSDGSLDLVAIWQQTNDLPLTPGATAHAEGCLGWVEKMQPVFSRQVAALAVGTARALAIAWTRR